MAALKEQGSTYKNKNQYLQCVLKPVSFLAATDLSSVFECYTVTIYARILRHFLYSRYSLLNDLLSVTLFQLNLQFFNRIPSFPDAFGATAPIQRFAALLAGTQQDVLRSRQQSAFRPGLSISVATITESTVRRGACLRHLALNVLSPPGSQ